MTFHALFKSTIFVSLVVSAAAVVGAAGFCLNALMDMPRPAKVVDTLRNHSFPLASEVFDRNGHKIGEFAGERRYFVPLSAMPSHVVDAFLTIEDANFYEHFGLSPKSIMRALWANLKGQRLAQGASTITQQLVRTYFLTREKTWERKLREAVLAIAIESMMSKDEILELYLNKIFLGNHSYGVEAAARNYFRKRIGDVNVAEAAMLAALPKAPSWLAPHRHYKRADARKNHVLSLMQRKQKLSPEDFRKWRQYRVTVAPESQRSNTRAPYYVDAVRRSLLEMFELQTLPRTGLKITTTFDSQVHAAAQTSLRQAIATFTQTAGRLEDELQGASVTIDLASGGVLSLLGGADFWDSQFNRALNTKRQMGSVLIPFYMGKALDRGYSITHRFSQRSQINKWLPPVPGPTLYEAIVYGRPFDAARVYPALGHGTMKDHLESLGLAFDIDDMSLALGFGEATPIAVAQAATSFAGDGRVLSPYFLANIAEEDGSEMYRRSPRGKEVRVMSEAAAYVLRTLGEHSLSVGEPFGKMVGTEGFGAFSGGPEDKQNGWLVAFNAKIVTVMWVGSEKGRDRLAATDAAVRTNLHSALAAFIKELPKSWKDSRKERFPEGVSFARFPEEINGEIRILPFLTGSEPAGNQQKL